MISTNKIHQHTGEAVENKSLCMPLKDSKALTESLGNKWGCGKNEHDPIRP
jgi:hypothetical protein